MIKNYFFLNRFVIEDKSYLTGNVILNIFSQEKDKLVIELGKNDDVNFLEISANPGDPYIIIRNHYSRAKKNTIEFFPSLRNKSITSVRISNRDRIIKFGLEKSNLFFTIRGKDTNVITISDDRSSESFKKTSEEKLKSIYSVLTSQEYIDEFNNIDLELVEDNDYWNQVKKKYPVLSKEIINEAKRRCKDESKKSKYLKSVLDDIQFKPMALFIDDHSGKVYLAVSTFGIFEYTDKKTFNSLTEAQNFYLSKKYYLKEKTRRVNLIQSHIDKEKSKLSNKINNLRNRISKGSREEEYKNIGNLLLLNRGKIKTGTETLSLKNVYGKNEDINVKLDKKLSVQKNIDLYFEKARAEKINFIKSNDLLSNALDDFEKLKKIESKVSKIESLKDYISIMKQLKIKDKDQPPEKTDLKIKFKHYIIRDKYNVYVGKDSKNNDLLTTRFTKQNDFWFHARGYSGSHVVLKVENPKEAIPKDILKKAASLAAYHSKAKTAGLVPVAYTLKKYVVKKKGDPVGTVHLLKEDSLLVKPEIPKECEYIFSEE